MNINILDFLMENDVVITSYLTDNAMTADEAFELGGEFVVYEKSGNQRDLYRGSDLTEAIKVLTGKSE